MDAFSRGRQPVPAPVNEERRAGAAVFPLPRSSRNLYKYGYPVGSAEGHHRSRGAGGRSCCAWPGKRRVRVPTLMPWRRSASVNGLEICYFEIDGAGDPLVLPYGAFGTI
jgi:hypothetical protein